jgi:transaldolase
MYPDTSNTSRLPCSSPEPTLYRATDALQSVPSARIKRRQFLPSPKSPCGEPSGENPLLSWGPPAASHAEIFSAKIDLVLGSPTFFAARPTGDNRHFGSRSISPVSPAEEPRRSSGRFAARSRIDCDADSRGDAMKATRVLSDLGQSLWLDNITRKMLKTGALKRYVDEMSVTGLTSNPTIFDHAIRNGDDYDDEIKRKLAEGKSGEELFFELALEDLRQAADLFRPVYDRTSGVDGWVSLEVSPLLAHDAKSTIAEVKQLHARARRPNLLIKIPGTREGLPAIEEAIFAGIAVNVTLLFSADQYVAAAEAFMRGVERRIEAGLNPNVGSVASVFVSRWDVAVAGNVPDELKNRLGIAIAKQSYKAYLGLLGSQRWMRAYNAGARPQRLLWASTGTKDPAASDILYVKALAAPFTVDTVPESTLKALAEHGVVEETMPTDGGDCEDVLARFAKAGIDIGTLSSRLQDEGARSFANSWDDLMSMLGSKCAVLKRAS